MKSLKIGLILLFVLSLTTLGYAQSWDYEKYPKLDIDIQHLDADLRILESGGIKGDVLYRAQLRINNPDSLVLDASGLDIQSVLINETAAEFLIHDEKLVIDLENDYARSSTLNVRIQYEAVPNFGVHRNVLGTIWTSMLPKSVRHWLPVIDHPRVEFTTQIRFTHPSGHTLIANGRRVESEILNLDEQVTTYSSNRKLPANALAWISGNLTQTSSGTITRLQQNTGSLRNDSQSAIQVHVYSESGVAGDTTDLASKTTNALEAVRNHLNIVYPYRDLNVVILEEDFWEMKTYSPGLIFAYKSKGNIEQQIQSGVISQWFGSYLREEQWSDTDAIHILHATLANQLFEFEYSTEQESAPYNSYSDNRHSNWQYFLVSNDMSSFKSSLELTLNSILSDNHNILGWNELSEIIYDATGQPFFDGFEPVMIEIEEDETPEFVYSANVEWNETDNTIQINFFAENESISELVTVSVEEVTFQGSRQHEITFTGADDSSVISVSGGVENIKLSIQDRENIELKVQKPFLFWIYQLRNETDADKRKEAARGVANDSGNPDLQLALDDVLRSESNPQVYAEIIRALAKITNGAAGMDQRFLEYSSFQRDPEVQEAAIEALVYFNNNERVISRLQTIILQSGNQGIQRKAIESLSEVTTPDRFSSTIEGLVSRESVLEHVPFMLELLGGIGAEEDAVDIASTFIVEQFPYKIRREALEILIQFDRSPENWSERLPELLTDRHPRIRYRAVEALRFLNSGNRQELVNLVLGEEYDERVRRTLD